MTKTMKLWIVLNNSRFWHAVPTPAEAWAGLYFEFKLKNETPADFIKRFETRGWRCVEATATWEEEEK